MFRVFVFSMFSLMSTLGWSQGLVVSTHPIYLIAKEITKGVEEPQLLLQGQSGHDVQLTPAHRKAINDASLVIWLGKAHEAPLNKLLSNNKKAISLLDSGILTVLPQRNTRGVALPNTVDTHVWLEPNNAVRIGFFIAALRSQQHPESKAKYWNMLMYLLGICCRQLKLTIAQVMVNLIGLIMMLISIWNARLI